jgi:hypothetical protein
MSIALMLLSTAGVAVVASYGLMIELVKANLENKAAIAEARRVALDMTTYCRDMAKQTAPRGESGL